MKEELDQPETYLRQVLESVAVLIRQGPYSNTWQLKPQYRENSFDYVKDEIAPGPEISEDQGLGDAGASEDDENVKMEDVL